jgi:hypothetical protein
VPIEVIAGQSATLLAIAIYGTLAPKTSSMLRSYFITQGFYVIALFGAQLFIDRNNQAFAILYVLFTALMLWWVAIISFIYAICHPSPLTLILGGLLIGVMPAAFSAHYQMPWEMHGWIQLIEGSFLIGAGLICGMSAPFLHWANRKIALTLSVMWVLLGVFREGYRMHWYRRPWEIANDWLPWLITCVGMGVTAYLMHRYSKALAHEWSAEPQPACQNQ